MRIGLHDAEQEYMRHKTFPNYALMKISAYHKANGDSVEWWSPMCQYDRVYSSKVFDFTPENLYLPPDTIRGGTGYDDIPINQQLPPEIDAAFPDYSIYPECDYAIGYLTRGCPNHCPWCVVPEKEGGIKPYREWKQVVRPDTNKLVLMDNNILASEYGISQLESMIGSGYAIDLNQGMDARLVDDRIAGILARLTWIRFIRFSCDQIPQIEAIERAAELLGNHGKKPYYLPACHGGRGERGLPGGAAETPKGYQHIRTAGAERAERNHTKRASKGIRPAVYLRAVIPERKLGRILGAAQGTEVAHMTNEERFKEIYQTQITRTGAPELLAWLESTDFFTAPASTRFHGAYPGGLVDHSLNVYFALIDGPYVRDYSMETRAICALLHDLCKVDFYHQRADGSYTVKDHFPFGHGEKSVFLIQRFMKLAEPEALAIRWHMGAYDDAARGGSYSLSAAMERTPLVLALHTADMMATEAEKAREQG